MQCWSPDSDEGDLGHLDTFSTNALGLDHQQATHAPVHMLAAYLSARRVPSPHMPHHEHSGPRRPVPARPCPPQVALKTLEPHGHGNVLLDASIPNFALGLVLDLPEIHKARRAQHPILPTCSPAAPQPCTLQPVLPRSFVRLVSSARLLRHR